MKFPVKAKPGTLMNVTLLVSVETMKAIIARHGTRRLPTK